VGAEEAGRGEGTIGVCRARRDGKDAHSGAFVLTRTAGLAGETNSIPYQPRGSLRLPGS
jgi:hypothetical protein